MNLKNAILERFLLRQQFWGFLHVELLCFSFAEYLKVQALCRFEGKRVLVVSFPDDRSLTEVICVDYEYKEGLIDVDAMLVAAMSSSWLRGSALWRS